jgi:GTPase Era involved in 16S rRNA processing
VHLIDVPGFADTEGRDQEFLDYILKEVQKFKAVNLFVFVLNSDAKFDASQ